MKNQCKRKSRYYFAFLSAQLRPKLYINLNQCWCRTCSVPATTVTKACCKGLFVAKSTPLFGQQRLLVT